MAVGDVFLGHRVQVEPGVGALLVVALDPLLAVRDRELPQSLLLGLQRGEDLLAQDLLVEQVLDPDPEARCLVRVAGADAAPRGPDRELPEPGLAGAVEQHVVGHDQVRVGGDAQVADVDPAAPQAVDLLQQHLRIEHHPVADHAGLLRVEDPRGDQVELELLAVADDRVTGVVAALEADDHRSVLGEQVGDLALALVAPLGADYHHSWHDRVIMEGGLRRRGRMALRCRRRPPRSACRARTAAGGRRRSRPGARPSAARSAARAPPGRGWW